MYSIFLSVCSETVDFPLLLILFLLATIFFCLLSGAPTLTFMTELRHLQARNSKLENFDIDVYSNLNNAFQYENSIIMIANNNKNYSLRTSYIFPYSLERAGKLRLRTVNPITNRKEGLKWTGQTKKARGLTQKSERTRMGTTNLHTLFKVHNSNFPHIFDHIQVWL